MTPDNESQVMDLPTRALPPAIYVQTVTASPLTDITLLTFFTRGLASPTSEPSFVPAFTAALTDTTIEGLRALLEQVVLAKQTLAADPENPQ